jgi:hypothetical protein
VFGWEPGIGDPTVYGWVTVGAYALAAFCCWRAARVAGRQRTFWLVLAAITAILCVNKQLDLQTLLTDFGRFEARRHGWYEQRQTYQLAFVFLLGAVSALATIGLIVRMRRAGAPVWGGICGLALLLLFIFLRAASIEKVDWLITRHVGSLSVNRIAELGGATVIALSAWAATRRR